MLCSPLSLVVHLLTGQTESAEGISLTFKAGVWSTAMVTVFIGFICSTPFARLALRVWPVDPFGARATRFWTIVVVGVLSLATAIAFFSLTFAGLLNYSSRFAIYYPASQSAYVARGDAKSMLQLESMLNDAFVRSGWSSIVLGVLCIFCWAHIRAAHNLDRTFALFLRRFSTFADRSLVSDVIKSMPSGVPCVFIASRADHARNWNPFVWAFGGLRVIKPLKNLPVQIKTTDEAWIETVGKLISRASCIIVDLSATSPSIEVERQLIAKSGALDRLVVLADKQSMIDAPPDDILQSAIAYSPNLLNSAVSTSAKVGTVLAVWRFNSASLWGWVSLLVLPFVVTPSVSRATRNAMRESIQTTIERSIATGA